MARVAEMPKTEKQSRTPAEKLLAVIEGHLSQFSPEEQKAKWDGLERHLKNLSRGTHAKRRALRSRRANSL